MGGFHLLLGHLQKKVGFAFRDIVFFKKAKKSLGKTASKPSGVSSATTSPINPPWPAFVDRPFSSALSSH